MFERFQNKIFIIWLTVQKTKLAIGHVFHWTLKTILRYDIDFSYLTCDSIDCLPNYTRAYEIFFCQQNDVNFYVPSTRYSRTLVKTNSPLRSGGPKTKFTQDWITIFGTRSCICFQLPSILFRFRPDVYDLKRNDVHPTP